MNEVLTVIQETEILGKKVNLYRSIEEPLFEANEVAKWLDVKNVSQMIKQADIDDSEKAIFLKYTLGGNQNSLFVSEDAMYEILMRSRLKNILNLFVLLALLFLKDVSKKWFKSISHHSRRKFKLK